MRTVQFKRHHSDVIMPKKGTAGAACFDLYSYSMSSEGRGYTVRTGLSIALPAGHGMLLLPRSGLSTKYGLNLQNGVGVIDEDYRGELVLKFNRGYDSAQGQITELLQSGNRVAQALIIAIPEINWMAVEELPESERGIGGFGSSGTK